MITDGRFNLKIWKQWNNRISKCHGHMWCDLGVLEVKHVAFSVFYLIEVLIRLGEVHFAENPTESDQWFQSYSNCKILNTIENKRNVFLFLAVSHNQFSWLLTDPTRSQHIFGLLHWKCIKMNTIMYTELVSWLLI